MTAQELRAVLNMVTYPECRNVFLQGSEGFPYDIHHVEISECGNVTLVPHWGAGRKA